MLDVVINEEEILQKIDRLVECGMIAGAEIVNTIKEDYSLTKEEASKIYSDWFSSRRKQ